MNVPHAQGAGDRQYRRIVVSAGKPSRTAIERLSMLSVDDLAEKRRVDPDELSPLDIQDLHDEAFDVEEVTKRFFEKYKQVFKNVEAGLTGITRKEDVRYFTQRLLNRLMFVAFIEKKDWLSLKGQRDYLHSLLSAYKGDRDRSGSFYASRLKPLFFQGFNTENREDEEDRVIGTGPYLNGGLFEEDALDQRPGVLVPDGDRRDPARALRALQLHRHGEQPAGGGGRRRPGDARGRCSRSWSPAATRQGKLLHAEAHRLVHVPRGAEGVPAQRAPRGAAGGGSPASSTTTIRVG